MTATKLTSSKILWNPTGTLGYPVLIDARTDGDIAADPRLTPSAIRRFPAISGNWLILR